MNRLLTAAVAAASLWAAACSGSGSNVQPPPPTGKFGLASLNGTYAFTTSGEVFTGAAVNPMSRVGSFTADGKGGITGGIEDVNTSGVGTNLAIPITGGSYTVNQDGRGTLTLTLGQSSINFAFVLTSGSNGSIASDGLMIDETSPASSSAQSSTGSGNFILQNAASFGSTIPASNGTFVFDFSGLDGASPAGPDSIVGKFAVNNGVVSSGAEDENDSGNLPATPTPVTFTGTMAQDPLNTSTLASNGRGVAQLNGIQYVFYIVDGTRIRFISTTSGMLSGDAVLQPSAPANPSGSFAFVVAGSAPGGGVTRVGRFTITGSTMSNVLIDTNDAGSPALTNSATSTSVTMDAANPGRGVLVFTDPNHSGVPFTFVFYLSSATSGVIQEQSQSAANGAVDVADGSILAQTGTFSSSTITGTYGLNWSGISVQQGGTFPTQDEEDLLAQSSIMSLGLSGTADIFQFTNGVPRTDFGLGGTITLGGDGTGSGGQRNTMVINLNAASPINFVVYFANPQLALFAANDGSTNTRIVAGILKAQQ